MELKWIDRLGDWNPQLLRELKGHLKPRNVAIATAIGLVGQVLLLMTLATQLPVTPPLGEYSAKIYSRYCTRGDSSDWQTLCIRDTFGNFIVNWQLWWLDVFLWLSIIGAIAVLVIGVHMLIGDLAREENRGTLNFIRISPQSATDIFRGKMLGVPILLYLVVFLAIPLHLWAGWSASIPLVLILGFYGVVVASAACFYSGALLYGLVSGGLGGFQAWLGSGIVLLFQSFWTLISLSNHNRLIINNSLDWLHLFSPSVVLRYSIEASSLGNAYQLEMSKLAAWQWFYLPLGASVWSVIGFSVVNYAVGTYWFWQGLKRCFHNPTSTLLSKGQSYVLTACVEVALLGFAVRSANTYEDDLKWLSQGLFDNLGALLLLNLPLFLFLIAALSPHRQALQDWARYRREGTSARLKNLVQDLVWGEKSPALVAVALNLLAVSAMIIPWIATWPRESEYQRAALLAVLLGVNLISLCTIAAQLMLFMKTPKRAIWAVGTVAALIVLPPVVLGLLSIAPAKVPGAWLFSAFAWLAVKDATATTAFTAVLGQWLMLCLLSFQIKRQLRSAGESATKVLMSGRPSLPV